MSYVSPEQVNAAKELKLLDYFLLRRPDDLIKSSANEFSSKTYSSLKMSNGKWNYFAGDQGGVTALSFLTYVEKMSFQEAVKEILNCQNLPIKEHNNIIANTKNLSETKEVNKNFTLPERNENNKRVFAYLANRGISPHIINFAMKYNLLYEDKKYHNAVFIGYDQARKARYAFLRGTNSYKKFLGEAAGSDKKFSFKLGNNDSDTVHFFESAIDALSYASMLEIYKKPWKNYSLVSLGGAGNFQAAEQYLKENSKTKKIILCLDNDETGINCSRKLKLFLENLGGYTVIDNPPMMTKDYNDELKFLKERSKSPKEKSKDDGRER